MAAISLEVHGIVQGVGFRYMTKILADQIGVTGKVLNKNDGSVYIEAQGDPFCLYRRDQSFTYPSRARRPCHPQVDP